jgi:hypothetical protein
MPPAGLRAVVLMGGLSGAGKSQTCEWAVEDLRMLHLEVDLPGVDGIDHHGLRSEWNDFYSRHEGASLAPALRHRAAVAGRAGVLLSLPSNAVLTTDHVAAARAAGMHVVIASGPPALCLNAFLTRERESGRGFDERRWHQFNDGAVATYNTPEYTPLLVPTFNRDGRRASRSQVISRLSKRIAV